MMMQGQIDMGHGRALLSLSPAQQIEIANLVIHKQLSVRETEKVVNRIEVPAIKKTEKQEPRVLPVSISMLSACPRGAGEDQEEQLEHIYHLQWILTPIWSSA